MCDIYKKELVDTSFDFELAREAYRKSNELSKLISKTVMGREDLESVVNKRYILCARILDLIQHICIPAQSSFLTVTPVADATKAAGGSFSSSRVSLLP